MKRNPTQNYLEFKAISESSNLPEIVRENLKLVIRDKLKNIPRDSNFSMLDVGTSDGEMVLPLAQWLKGKFDNFTYTAIEPEQPAFERLNERIKIQGIDYAEASNLTIEDYLEAKKGEEEMFDFILFSHVFYHIPKDKWSDVISGSQKLLKPNGFIAVVLDSFEGQACDLLNLITENKTRVDTLEFGNLYSAEDMEDFLKKKGIKYSVDKFPVHILVPEGEQKLSDFARHLAFLYRTFPDVIMSTYKKEVEEMLERNKKGENYYIEDVAKVVTFFKNS